VLGRFGMPTLAPGARQHVKYPVVVDDGAFRGATGFHEAFDEEQTLAAFRSGEP
jgi:UDP-glucose 4-epimerase